AADHTTPETFHHCDIGPSSKPHPQPLSVPRRGALSGTSALPGSRVRWYTPGADSEQDRAYPNAPSSHVRAAYLRGESPRRLRLAALHPAARGAPTPPAGPRAAHRVPVPDFGAAADVHALPNGRAPAVPHAVPHLPAAY